MPLSAFAARKALQKPNGIQHDSTIEAFETSTKEDLKIFGSSHDWQTVRPRSLKRKISDQSIIQKVSTTKEKPRSTRKRTHAAGFDAFDHTIPSEAALLASVQPSASGDVATQYSSLESDSYESSHTSEIDSSDKTTSTPKFTQLLSSFTPSQSNLLSSSRKEWAVRLTDGDTLTSIGHYDLWVRKGTISILGTVLHSSSKLHRVYAPASHSLPSIRHIRNPFGSVNQPAEISILSCSTRIRLLRRVSRKFRRIWNRANPEDEEDRSPYSIFESSFGFLKDSSEDTLQRPLAPLIVFPEWQNLIVQLTDIDNYPPKVIMISGPKGSGKSTFTRLLMNGFMTKSSASPGVYLLDLDPGQPEYSPPGDVALLHLMCTNLGPPFTHPLVPEGSDDTLIRAHHVGAITPRDDPYHYIQCALELYAHYRRRRATHSMCSLIINSCGWVVGSGLELLEDLVHNIAVTDVAYMSTSGPEEAVEILQKAATRGEAAFYTLRSQPKATANRTASELRAMQTQSYFHLDEPEDGALRWNASPIHTVEPMELHYAGPQQDILGIMILGEEMSTRILADLINGSVLALVAIEDDTALPEDALAEYNEIIADRIINDAQDTVDPPGLEDGNARAIPRHVLEVRPPSNRDNSITLNHTSPLSDAHPLSAPTHPTPSIRRTPESIPYLFTGSGTNVPLHPSSTHCIGQVLVRGIDTRSHVLQILTPIPPTTLATLHTQGAKLVLVRGKLDMPTWAYEEECVEALTAQREKKRWRKWREKGEVQDSEGYEGSDGEPEFNVEAWASRQPWVEVEAGGREKKGEKMGKARRELGKQAEKEKRRR